MDALLSPPRMVQKNLHHQGDAPLPTIGVIIPACNEEACIAAVLEELLAEIDGATCVVAVGVNDSLDRTAEIARQYPVAVAETSERGYGHGCRAAIEALTAQHPGIRAYVFFAGDGASNPRDIAHLVDAFAIGDMLVLGARTMRRGNWQVMGCSHVLANFALALWTGFLSGRWYTDLAPLRLIERHLFDALALEEMTFGWTIEAQIGAAMLGARIREVSAEERSRIAGQQKVSGVTWRRTASIGWRIVLAGWRSHLRYGRREKRRAAASAAQAQTSASSL